VTLFSIASLSVDTKSGDAVNFGLSMNNDLGIQVPD
jgi:hypothetical protein